MRDGQGNYSLSRRTEQSGAVELQPMTVEGFALGNALGSMEGYNATHSSVATKTSMPLAETSQTVSVVTRQQIEDQGSRSIAQAVRYTPGLMSTPYGATTRYDYVAMRGITDGSVDNLYLDGQKLLGDSGTYSSLQVDPYFIERIDILKGPSSVLYGRSLPGGLVAMTSKKPQKEASRQLQFSYGSHDYKQAAFDFTGPLDDERISYRLVGVAKDADTQVDGIEEQRYAVMPSGERLPRWLAGRWHGHLAQRSAHLAQLLRGRRGLREVRARPADDWLSARAPFQRCRFGAAELPVPGLHRGLGAGLSVRLRGPRFR